MPFVSPVSLGFALAVAWAGWQTQLTVTVAGCNLRNGFGIGTTNKTITCRNAIMALLPLCFGLVGILVFLPVVLPTMAREAYVAARIWNRGNVA